MSAIASMEKQIEEMKAMLDREETKNVTKRTKKERDPGLSRKQSNPWIKFTQRVSKVLDDAGIKTGSAPVAKQFASSLKDQKEYDDWTDEDILRAWALWEKPRESFPNDNINLVSHPPGNYRKAPRIMLATMAPWGPKIKTGNLLGLQNKRNQPNNLLSFEPTEEGLKSRENELKNLFGGKRKTRRLRR